MRSTDPVARTSRRFLAPLLGVGAAAVLAAGCGASSHSSSASTTAPTAVPVTTAAGGGSTSTAPATTAPAATTTAPATTAPASTAPAGPQPCATAQLTLSLGLGNGAAGSTYVPLYLANSGPSTCTLSGYPGVSYVGGGNGTQIGAAATRDPSTPVATVSLAPGQRAQSQLRLIDPYDFDTSTCKMVPVQGFRVYPPGQTAAAFVKDPGQACSSTTLPQPALFVGAVRAG
ncbi:DUF4232 domain-containing protein [Acidiferrimicrobium sp. IK]|uniref:DUF4232 domain-containing protein n=1 Tax=Acidiferrimicrobium sp. IK TaxID=2871700 RepID=UPI0021CAECE7|nr:DUF4232 domain-containing protein [Acidiferrimicrobium sp. IK]MCU4183585.1 DUF4232 domain-containing protein [Acidiferrimicrobium sp. IK]